MQDPIAIIGAMQVEIDQIIANLENPLTMDYADITVHRGLLHGAPVVVMRSGVGKVSAAMCTQSLIDHFSPEMVINTGIGGSLDASLNIGDIVVSSDLVQHDVDVTALGYEPGVIPQLGGEGRGMFNFEADENLRDALLRAAEQVAPEITAASGRIASGDQFIAAPDQRKKIVDTFGARCCEMEGAAIAQVCWRNGLPFVVARVISDKADGSADMDYPTFEEQAAHRCAAIVSRAIELLGE